jgi:hypothetical protein
MIRHCAPRHEARDNGLPAFASDVDSPERNIRVSEAISFIARSELGVKRTRRPDDRDNASGVRSFVASGPGARNRREKQARDKTKVKQDTRHDKASIGAIERRIGPPSNYRRL